MIFPDDSIGNIGGQDEKINDMIEQVVKNTEERKVKIKKNTE